MVAKAVVRISLLCRCWLMPITQLTRPPLSSRELENAPAGTYTPEDAKPIATRVATAGEWADSISLAALAQATNAEFRIWGWSQAENRWKFYILGPRLKKPTNPQVDRCVCVSTLSGRFACCRSSVRGRCTWMLSSG